MLLEYIIIILFLCIVFCTTFDIFINNNIGKRSLVMLRYSKRDKCLTTNIALGIFVGSTISMIVSTTLLAFIINFITVGLSFVVMINENYKKKV